MVLRGPGFRSMIVIIRKKTMTGKEDLLSSNIGITNARSLCYDRHVKLMTNDGKFDLYLPYGSYDPQGGTRFTDEYIEITYHNSHEDDGSTLRFRRINLSDCYLKILEANCRFVGTTSSDDGIIVRTYSMDTGIKDGYDMRMDVIDRRNMDKDLRGRDPLLSLVNGDGETVAYTDEDIRDKELLKFVGIILQDDGSNE